MLLASYSEVPAALASFYALGAKRNGWLYYRALEGRGAADRAALIAAGLAVDALEAEGRMVFAEMRPEITVEEYVQGWEEEMQAALSCGFDAAWCARFPVGRAAALERAVVEPAVALGAEGVEGRQRGRHLAVAREQHGHMWAGTEGKRIHVQ
jgi:hypothetical protein